jgi:hypothetical protein
VGAAGADEDMEAAADGWVTAAQPFTRTHVLACVTGDHGI